MSKKTAAILLIADILIMACVFSMTGVFNTSVDTSAYVSQIEKFSSHAPMLSLADPATAERFFKPFYGIVGSWMAPVADPYVAMRVIDIIFFIGLTFLSYLMFRELDFDERYSVAGAVWVAAGYPMLKYGLALGTDISGWFFTVAVIILALRAFRKGDVRYIIMASFVGFIGSLTKETGVLGLIFAGLYILAQFGVWNYRKVIKWLVALCAPFFVLEGVFLYMMHVLHAPTFSNWYSSNLTQYAHDYYKLHYFIGVECSTFNILLILACIGLFFAIRNRDALKRAWATKYACLLAASLPVLLWPIFISRILFAQFIFVIPLALYGVMKLDEIWKAKHSDKKILGLSLAIWLFALPIIVSAGLFLVSGTGALSASLQRF